MMIKSSNVSRHGLLNPGTTRRRNIDPDGPKACCCLSLLLVFVVWLVCSFAVPERQRLSLSLNTTLERNSSDSLVPQQAPSDYELLAPTSAEERSFAITVPNFAWSWSAAFNIYEVGGGKGPVLLYKVRGSMNVQRFKKEVTAPANATDASLKSPVFSWLSTYDIRGSDDDYYGTIKEQGLWDFVPSYNIDISNSTSSPAYTIESDMWLDLAWMRNADNETVAKISQQDGLLQSFYSVHVAAGMDPLLVLACAVATITDKLAAAAAASSSSSSSAKGSKGGKRE